MCQQMLQLQNEVSALQLAVEQAEVMKKSKAQLVRLSWHEGFKGRVKCKDLINSANWKGWKF